MAESGFSSVKRDPETGEFWVKEAGISGYRPASPAEVAGSFETTVEALGQGIGRGVESAVRGIPQAYADLVRPVNEALAGPFGWEYDEGAATANRARLQEIADMHGGSAAGNPLAANVGFFLPEAAAAVGTGGVGVGGSLARRATIYGAGGFAGGAAASPEDPLAGGLLGLALGPVAGLGGEVITRGLVRGLGKGRAIIGASRRMDQVEPPAGALRGVDPEAPGGMAGVRQGDIAGPPGSITGVDPRAVGAAHNRGWGTRMAGIWDAAPDEALNREAAELGFRLTPGVARGSTSMRQIEANMESMPGGAAAFAELREQNDLALKGHLVKALGGEGNDLSPEALGVMKGRLENTFEDAGRQIGDVDLKGALREINRLVDDIDDPDVQGWLGSIANKVPADIKGPSLMKKLQYYRRMADNQWSSQSGHRGKAEALDDLADIVERHMLRQAPRQVGAALEEAGERWRLLRTVERGKTITSDGQVSPVGLDSALRGGYKNEYRYGGTTGNPDIETLARASKVAYAMRDIVGNSGTATRSQNPLKALTLGPVQHAYAKSYLQGLDLKDYLKAGAGATAGVAGASAAGGLLFGE